MHYEPIKGRLITPTMVLMVVLMLAGAAAFIARFALGLGPTTGLCDNYPWGLWIVFDLVWIALAGGAFVTAGIVYVFHAEQFHALARPAVWMGLLSYNFVVVTLLADLGLPWHFWQLAVQLPDHSAMYEVSWCVTLYVTILGLEFAPVLFERFGWEKLRRLWLKLSPIYTVLALALFVFLMSHKLWMAALALVVFAVIAWLTADSGRKLGVPILLIIAAVTFSTMHQSSLGSLFLLMPDKLSPLWWSPILPLLFFFSAVAAGLALVMLLDLAVSRFFARPYQWAMLARLGQVLFGALLLYYGLRLGDLTLRGAWGHLAGLQGSLLLLEILLGGVLPIVLLAKFSWRERQGLLLAGILLTLFGVILNRLNIVLLGMNLPGTLPGGLVQTYTPSLVEWTLSISLIAAAVFFFAAGCKLLPILPKQETR